MMISAEIVAAGTELLGPDRLDTNSLAITEELHSLGVEVSAKHVVGDNRERLANLLREATGRANLVIVSGGLGPTEDDVTREAAAAALGLRLVHSPEAESVLRARFRQINRPMAENNLQQTYLIEGAEMLANPNGTACGQFIATGKSALALLPGPPRELKPMLANELVPRLKRLLPSGIIRTRTFRITGIGESDLDALIAPVYTKYTNPVTTVLSATGDLRVILRASGEQESEADALLREVGDRITKLLGDRVYTENPAEGLETVVGGLLRTRDATVASAESCTGGLLAARLTDGAGSSDFYAGGFVTYSNEQKQHALGVPADLLEKYTAVSEPVAAAMAEGARQRTGSTFALSTTGYAGPSGGTERDPVGTVYLGLAGPDETRVVRARYGTDRFRVRTLATQHALDLLRKTLLGGE
ncbi:MAG: competence/damage-inducible protein A [Bryobacteraceae bacterium]